MFESKKLKKEHDASKGYDGRPVRKCRMEKPKLQVLKWLGTVPAVGVCTFCDRLFNVPMTAMKRVADAQESLRVQFTEHKCKRENAS